MLHDEAKIKIIDLLRSQSVATRYQLQQETGLSDRLNRKLIVELRKSGILIINIKKGYKIATASELEQFRAREIKRARSIFETLKKMLTPESYNQLTLDIL